MWLCCYKNQLFFETVEKNNSQMGQKELGYFNLNKILEDNNAMNIFDPDRILHSDKSGFSFAPKLVK